MDTIFTLAFGRWATPSRKSHTVQVDRGACDGGSLLFVFMFFHWFGVKATNTSNLLFR
jgi:hypothetical protein